MRKIMLIGSVVAIGVANLGVGTAAGYGTPPVNATGSLHCTVAGVLSFSPPLFAVGSVPARAKAKFDGSGCTGTSGVTTVKGKLTATFPLNACVAWTQSFTSQLAMKYGGAVKYARSTINFTGSEVTGFNGPVTLEFPGAGTSSVGTGSFPGTHPTLTLAFDLSGNAIGNMCFAPKSPRPGREKKLTFSGASSFDIG